MQGPIKFNPRDMNYLVYDYYGRGHFQLEIGLHVSTVHSIGTRVSATCDMRVYLLARSGDMARELATRCVFGDKNIRCYMHFDSYGLQI